MYIFTRMRTARSGRYTEARAEATKIAATASSVAGTAIATWNVQFGQAAGTFMWSTRVESQAELAEKLGRLGEDPGYQAEVAKLEELFEGPAEDRLVRILAGTPADAPMPIVSFTEAQYLGGKAAEAMAFGADLAEYAAAGTGLPVLFGANAYGEFDGVGWVVSASSMDDVDRMNDWALGDTGYQERLAKVGDLFQQGSGRRSLMIQLG